MTANRLNVTGAIRDDRTVIRFRKMFIIHRRRRCDEPPHEIGQLSHVPKEERLTARHVDCLPAPLSLAVAQVFAPQTHGEQV